MTNILEKIVKEISSVLTGGIGIIIGRILIAEINQDTGMSIKIAEGMSGSDFQKRNKGKKDSKSANQKARKERKEIKNRNKVWG